MSFIGIGNNELNIGEHAAEALRTIIRQLIELQTTNGISAKKALELLQFDGDDLRKTLITALRTWVVKKGLKPLEDLLVNLKTIEGRNTKKDRVLGWPAEEWNTGAMTDAADSAFSFEINAGGTLAFEVLKDKATAPNGLSDFDRFNANVALLIGGELSGGVEGSINIPYGGFKASANASISRSIQVYYGIQDYEKLAGLVLASALSQLRSPADGEALLKVFEANELAQLHGVIVQGDGKLGGGAEVTAKLPTQYGTFGIDLDGELSTSESFRYAISRGDKEKTLDLRVNTNSSSSSEAGIGVSYTVGLSTIAPEAAQQLLKNMTAVHGMVVKVDEKAQALMGNQKFVTWLKPGNFLQKNISEWVQESLDEIGAKDNITALGSLARAFGIDQSDISSDDQVKDVIEKVGNYTTQTIVAVLDELPDVFELDAKELSKQLTDVFGNAIDGEIKKVLNTRVFMRLRNEIDSHLEALANKLDEQLAKGIETFLGEPVDDALQRVKNFLTQIRNTSQKILDGISKAQTELLAAELGWRRQSSRAFSFDYEAEFDLSVSEASKAFSKAVSSPHGFGKLLLSDQRANGVLLNDYSSRGNLVRKTGHRWNIAFIGIELGTDTDRIENIDIEYTSDGVTVGTRGSIKKSRKFLRETREVSFVTAMNLAQAQNNNNSEGESDPGAAASIKIHFEEYDSKLHTKEATRLMQRFNKAGLLSDDVQSDIITEIKRAQNAVKRNDVNAVLSLGIAIPPDIVIELLSQSRDKSKLGMFATEDVITKATINALIEHDPESIDEAQFSHSTATRGIGLKEFALERPEETPNEAYQRRKAFMGDLHTAIQQKSKTLGIKNGSKPTKKVKYLAAAVASLKRVLEFGAEVYFDTTIPRGDDGPNKDGVVNGLSLEERIKEMKKNLRVKQEMMNKTASVFLKTGTPNPLPFWGGRAPKRTVAMFAALQEVTKAFTKTKPPLMVTLTPKNGTPRAFINLDDS